MTSLHGPFDFCFRLQPVEKTNEGVTLAYGEKVASDTAPFWVVRFT